MTACKRGNDSTNDWTGSETAATVPGWTQFIQPVDLTTNSRVEAIYSNGKEAEMYGMLETLGGGAAVFDFDLDSCQDLLFAGGGRFPTQNQIVGEPSTLWHQRTNMEFDPRAESALIDTADFFTHGAFPGDFNRDGFQDVLFTGFGGVRLYVNMGDGTFEHDPAGLPTDRWSTGAAWGDWNGDGELDLFIANYLNWSLKNNPPCGSLHVDSPEICSPRSFEPLNDYLFLSDGEGGFVDHSAASGIVPGGKGLGILAVDIDLDSDLDIYVANDTTANFLYINDGKGRFTESALLQGVGVDEHSRANGSMGISVGDYDGDLKLDLGVSNYEHESFAIYHQEQAGVFMTKSQATGISDLGQNMVGWGSCFLDLDADGDEDLVIVNGHVLNHPSTGTMPQQSMVLVNENGRFSRARFDEQTYLSRAHHGRGFAWGDLNQDGSLELVFSNVGQPAAILSCDKKRSKLDGKHLFVRLIGSESHRDGHGAHVKLTTRNGEQIRAVSSSGSYLSSSQAGVCFGIASEDDAQSLTVVWANGESEHFMIGGSPHVVVVQGSSER